MRRKFIAATGILFSVYLTGCSLLQKEEEYHVLKVDDSAKEETDVMTQVKRGDIAEESVIRVTVTPTKKEELCFHLNGEEFDEIYVRKGDRVKKGQLLMNLVCDSLQDELREIEYEKERILIDKKEYEELYRCQMKEKPAYKEALRIKEEYENAMADFENNLAVLELKKEDCLRKINERCLYAGMDGVVTGVTDKTSTGKSIDGITMITIVAQSYNYTANTTQTEGLAVGETYTMEQRNGNIEVVLNSITEKENGSYNLEFGIADANQISEENASEGGKITLLIKKQQNVLYVETSAVVQADGVNYVYMKEGDMWNVKEVKVGPKVGKYYVIESGLSEGENVLCD